MSKMNRVCSWWLVLWRKIKQRAARNSSGRGINDALLSMMVRRGPQEGGRLCSYGGWEVFQVEGTARAEVGR